MNRMNRKICIVLAFVVVLMLSFSALADYRESQYVRDEAARRNMTLISESEAGEIALKRLGNDSARVKEIDLDNEADDYPNGADFRPVYQIECISGIEEYDIDVDAVTGEVLKFKRDD